MYVYDYYDSLEDGIMKRQSKPWKCGPATVRNTLRAFGVKVSEDTLSGLCGTTEEGTDEDGIMHALKYYGYKVEEFQSNSKSNAWAWLHGNMSTGNFVILCLESWEHWVVAVGRCGDRITIVDPSNFKYNSSELNTHVWAKDWLMYKWWNARKSIEGQDRLYAVSVSSSKK